MSDIQVHRSADNDQEFSFDVIVRDGKGESSHVVTLSRADFDDLSKESEEPEDFVKRCFEFLLERESKDSILSEFDISVIGRYFPEFEQTIRG